MRVSFNQPAFIPWGGFYARLLNSDLMILLDETQFARGFTFVNRNRLKGPQGEIWVTVPVKKKDLGFQKINQLRIHQPEKWSENFLSMLRHYYGRSLYFGETYEKLTENFREASENFPKLALSIIHLIGDNLGIKTPVGLQSETGINLKGAKLLIDLAKQTGAKEVLLPYLADRHLDLDEFVRAGLKVSFLRYNQLPYPQFWGDFIANLSALDLFLCCGPDGIKVINKSSRVVQK